MGVEVGPVFAYHCLPVSSFKSMNNTVFAVEIYWKAGHSPSLPISLPQTFIEKLLYDRHSADWGSKQTRTRPLHWQANSPERDLHVERWDEYDTMWQVI